MRRVRSDSTESLGHDSFLDVVANLVGILIILVVLVGTQAGQQIASADTDLEQAEAQLEAKRQTLAGRRRTADSLDRDNAELQARLKQETALAEIASAERDRLQQLVVLAEQEIASRLSAADQERAAAATQLAETTSLQRRLQELERMRFDLESTPVETRVLEHHATPLARTVFNDEIHFRVKDGRIVHVPMEALVDRMTETFRFQIEKLGSVAETTETVGPIEEFRLQYAIRIEEQTVRTDLGPIRRQVPQFVGFVLLPTRPILGEELGVALGDPNSDLQRRLAPLDTTSTTVTVWVYPDSYDQYLQLETWLHEKGFLVASWPLPSDQPIAGGPNGMRSVAQ